MDRNTLRSFLSLPPQDTKVLAVQLRYKNPYMTLQQIADRCGVSKQRIYAIFKKYRIPKRPQKLKTLPYCKNCGLISWYRSKFCSVFCRKDYFLVKLSCSQCGKPIERKKKDVKYKIRKLQQYNFFCDLECYWIRRRARKAKLQ